MALWHHYGHRAMNASCAPAATIGANPSAFDSGKTNRLIRPVTVVIRQFEEKKSNMGKIITYEQARFQIPV
jgi:hypothetical protein